MNINPLLMTDGYKTSHHLMYPEGTTLVYSNFTPRSINYMPNEAKDIVVFGIQYTVKYINELYEKYFFKRYKYEVIKEVKDYLSSYLNTDYDVSHFEKLHDLGYLPVTIKGLPEGTISPVRVPILTIYNTHPDFYWLPNFLETLISSLLWKPLHSASMAYGFRKVFKKYALETNPEAIEFVDFQGHDFSFRGMQHPESAISSGLGFLTSFKGTDTIPALQAAKHYYNTSDVGFSVPASEHAVITAYGKDNEIDGFRRIINQFPTGIVSVVSDSFDLWTVLTKFLPEMKEQIMSRDGKVVIRPDSGDPVDIICGTVNDFTYSDLSKWYKEEDSPINHPEYFEDSLLEEVREDTPHGEHGPTEWGSTYQINGKLYKATIHNISWNRHDKQYYFIDMWEKAKITVEEIQIEPSHKGVVELLWDVFGGTVNKQGYKVLDSHIGCIYGDSISLDRASQICERLKKKGFASTNWVAGIGSYSMGYATRDSQGSAIKATYIEVEIDIPDSSPFIESEYKTKIEGREIFKDPITDNGVKKSAKGLLRVDKVYTSDSLGDLHFKGYELKDQCTWEEEEGGELQVIFEDGKFYNEITLTKIRERLRKIEKVLV